MRKKGYYPFGMAMPGRSYSVVSGYRFGFGGKEKDNEVKENGSQIAYENRIYDPRLGRWLSVDPLQKKYSDLTPYNFSGNNPVVFGDYDGRDFGLIYDHKNKKIYIVGNYYVTKQEEAQVTSALNAWNAKSAVASDGYTIVFALKPKVVEVQTKEQYLASTPWAAGLRRSEQNEKYKQYIDNEVHRVKEMDPIGNAYFGSDFISSKVQTMADPEVVGGVTKADYMYMNTGDDGTDFAQNSDLITHEVGHTFGLQDPPKTRADKPLFHPKGGVMEYTLTGSQKPINSNDITTVYEYAKGYVLYHAMKTLIPGLPANDNFEGRAKVGMVTTVENIGRAVSAAIIGISF